MAAYVVRRAAWPLHAAALAFGLTTSAFFTFAVDHVAAGSDRPPLALGGLVFLGFGVAGGLGFLADALERRAGPPGAMALAFAAAATGTAALALVPDRLLAVMAGAGLVGASVMIFAALLAMAAMRVFPALPVMGLTVTVLAMSVGSVAGPAATGALADAFGTGAALMVGAAVAGIAAVTAIPWRRPATSRPIPTTPTRRTAARTRTASARAAR